MYRVLLGLASALTLAVSVGAANAAPEAMQVPESGIAANGPKLPALDTGGVNEINKPGEKAAAGTPPTPEAVFRSGCIRFPGQKITYSLLARGLVLYRVFPQRFFDVTMRVNYVGIRSFFVDRRGAGGAESILIQGPSSSRLVRVTIGGFRGFTGCFSFAATP